MLLLKYSTAILRLYKRQKGQMAPSNVLCTLDGLAWQAQQSQRQSSKGLEGDLKKIWEWWKLMLRLDVY